jgi:hypothetical protein
LLRSNGLSDPSSAVTRKKSAETLFETLFGGAVHHSEEVLQVLGILLLLLLYV